MELAQIQSSQSQEIQRQLNRLAMKYKVFESGTVEGFLENNSDPRYSIRLSFNPRNKNNNDEQQK